MQSPSTAPAPIMGDQPIIQFRYRRAAHSAAAAARISALSSNEELRRLTDAFTRLGRDSSLVLGGAEDLETALDQVAADLETTRVRALRQALEKAEDPRPGIRFEAIRQLVVLGEVREARHRLEGVDPGSHTHALAACLSLVRAEGDIRRAEELVRAVFARNPQLVARSGASPDFLMTANGPPPAIAIVDPAAVANDTEFFFYFSYLLLCDRYSEAVGYSLSYLDRRTPGNNLVGKMLERFDALVKTDEGLQDTDQRRVESATLTGGAFAQMIEDLQRSVESAGANPNAWSAWPALAAKAVGLYLVEEPVYRLDGQPRLPVERLTDIVFQNANQPIQAGISESGYRLLSAPMRARQDCLLSALPVNDLATETLQAAQSARAKAFLSNVAARQCGGIVLSVHLSRLHGYGNLPLLAALASGLPAVSVVVGATSVEGELGSGQAGGERRQLRVVGRASGSVMDVSSDLLATLRNGGVVGIAMDVVHSPGATSTIPWLLRPISVPLYPAALAVGQRCQVGLSITWVDDSGELRNDLAEVDLPPQQGSTSVLSAWLMQRIAREARILVRDNRIPIDPIQIASRGGVPPKRKFISLEEWGARPGVAQSLVGWIANPRNGEACSAISLKNSETSFDVLRELTLRLANVLLHYENATSDHVTPAGTTGRQHRILMILPPGPAFAATALAGLAVGNLIGLCQDDVSTSQLAARLRTFRPDLVITTASAWSRLTAHVPEALDLTALVMDDRGDVGSIEDVVRGFDAVQALPPLEMHAPGPVIFTSGSTGVPKGCVHPLGVLVSADFEKVVGADVLFRLSPSDRLTYIARWESVCFFDILSCFRAGATAVVPDQNTLASPIEFSHWLNSEGVTCFAAPATLMGMMLQSRAFSSQKQPSLRLTMPWGERISRFVTEELFRNFPDCEHVASYGASEALWVGYGPLPRIMDNMSMASPGGNPVPQLHLSIVSVDEKEMPPHEIGHPKLSGPGVMLGYLDDLAARPSIGSGSGSEQGVVLNDFARVTPAGLELFGRSDSIHKIGGRRISLIEIETAAEMVEGVKEAVAFIDEGGSVARVLVAVVLESGAVEQVSSEVANSIAERCFDTARPSRILSLSDFPRLPSGKCDRKAVESMLLDQPPLPSAAEVALSPLLRTDLSPLLADMADWAASRFGIPVESFDPQSHVPDLDSLMVMELLLMAEAVHGRSIQACSVRGEASTWEALAVRLGDPVSARVTPHLVGSVPTDPLS